MPAPLKPSIDSAGGREYVKGLLKPISPHDYHDYVLEGICKAAAGLHVISVLPTGGGKTSYMYGFLKLFKQLSQLAEPCPFQLSECPANPLPTKGLEEEMARNFTKLGLNALVINEDTLAASTENLWAKAAYIDLDVLLLSPEQFSTKEYDHLLRNDVFSTRVACLSIDELHLVVDWGAPTFRECYREVGNTLARMPTHVVLIGLTATLPAGQDTQHIMDVLGLKAGSFFFSRRSNIRRDVCYVQRTLRHGLGGWTFPDLHWIVEGRRKTIVYCDTISLAFRVFVDLWYHIPFADTISRQERLRLYCSLFSKDYNEATRTVYVDDPKLQVIFATDALKVGNDFPNVADVVVLNPVNVNDILQKIGRAGRRRGLVANPGPRGITYVTKAMLDRAQALLDGKPKKNQGDSKEETMSKEMARVLTATCFITEINMQYENPPSELPCACETCSHTVQPHPSICNCSGCMPEATLCALPPQSRHVASHVGYRPSSEKLSKDMKERGRRQLTTFRLRIWSRASLDDSLIQSLPPSAILQDSTINWLLENFGKLKDSVSMGSFVERETWIQPYKRDLWEEVVALRKIFRRIDLELDSDDDSQENPRKRPHLETTEKSYDAFFTSFAGSSQDRGPTSGQDQTVPLAPSSLLNAPDGTNIQSRVKRGRGHGRGARGRGRGRGQGAITRTLSTEPLRRSARRHSTYQMDGNQENIYINS